MKLAEIKLKFIGDAIGKSKFSSELEKDLTPDERKAAKKRLKSMAAGISEDMGIGQLYAKFQGWLAAKTEPSAQEIQTFLDAMAVEAKSRGETVDRMIDDLMSPLEAGELQAVSHMKNAKLTAAAKLELSHREKGGTWDTPRTAG